MSEEPDEHEDKESLEERAEGTAVQRGKGGGPRMSREEQADRDAELVLDYVAGLPWYAIQEKYSLTRQRCQQIVAVWREHNRTNYAEADAIDVVYGLLDQYEALVSKCAVIAEKAESESTKVQAIQAQMSAIGKAVDLRQATGLLPKTLGTLRLELDARVMSHKLVQVLNAHDASPEMKRDIIAALESGS